MTSIFNFNRDQSFDLNQHYSYIQPINDKTEITNLPPTSNTDNTNQILFDYLDPREAGGLVLNLSTTPGIHYHLRLKGQLFLGDRVFIRVTNQAPEFHLIRELEIIKGYNDTESQCFRAMSNNTIITIKTNVDCFLNLAPYQFQLMDLQIVPDQNFCKGYFQGPQGPTGAQGHTGARGLQGDMLPPGTQGQTGETGPIGFQGFHGETGPRGMTGIQGLQGVQGIDGTGIGPTGFQGNRGAQGNQGSLGSMGEQGPIGLQGVQGNQGRAGEQGPTGSPGPDGNEGPQGVTGPQGIAGVRIGDHITTGSFNSTYTRNGLAAVSVTINWQKVGNQVTLFIPTFFSTGAATDAVLDGTILPNSIRTPALRQTYFPIIIELNGTNVEGLYRVGGTGENEFYRSLRRNDLFLSTDNIRIPSFSVTYYITS